MMLGVSSLTVLVACALVAVGAAGLARMLPNPSPLTLPPRRREALEASPTLRWFHPLIVYLAQFNAAYPESIRNEMDLKLRRAGRPSDFTAEEFLSICQISALGAGGMTLFYGLLLLGLPGIIPGMLAVLVGYMVPQFILNEWMNARLAKLVAKLPYAIDLLALCMGSGATFIGAVEVLVGEPSDEPLDQEFRAFLTELSLGKTRREALTNLADRCGVEVLNGLVMALIQGEEQGVQVAEILRRQSSHIRAIRVALADEKAQKASTKIMFPTMMTVAATLLILFGAFIVKMIRGKVLSG